VKVYESKDIRNVGLIGHSHSGKTSLASAMLYTAGVTNRFLSVDEGNTITDFDDEEIARKLTIASSVAHLDWKKTKINLIDTPGFNLFIGDVKAALVAADAALVMVDGVSGIEVMTERVWGYANDYKLPRAIVVNKLDRDRSSFDRSMESIHETFGRMAVPVQIPVGSERDFRGVVDLIRMKAYLYEPGGKGAGKEQAIPAELADAAQAAHEKLVEAVAEGKDSLMEEFFETGTLPEEHLAQGLREQMAEDRIFPVVCASSTQNIGTDLILHFVRDYFPSPSEHAKIAPLHAHQDQKEVTREMTDSEPAAIYAFKTVADPFSGRISFFRVMSGVLKNDDNLTNPRSGSAERLSHIGCPQGKTIEPVTELHAGDIGAVAKLKDTITGDTLCDRGSQLRYPAVKLPEPSIAYAIEAKTRQDEDRMSQALARLLEEDSSLRFYRDPQTKQFLLAGTGAQHVEIAVSRLKKRYNVDVTLKAPKIPYRETIRGFADVQGRHKKQTGGHGQFGDCKIKMEPLSRGEEFEFVNAIFGGSIPKQYIPAVEKGILEAAEKGYLAGYPVVDFKVTLYDGSYHDVDSSEMAFKLAGRKAFKAAMEQAKAALLEPIMNVEVVAPVEFAGDLMGDINSRRGRISGMETRGNVQITKAQIPMAEMLNYQNDLISMTQGRASFSMEFDHYDFVPQMQADKIIAAAKAAQAGEEAEDE
jgi:elongation factor G